MSDEGRERVHLVTAYVPLDVLTVLQHWADAVCGQIPKEGRVHAKGKGTWQEDNVSVLLGDLLRSLARKEMVLAPSESFSKHQSQVSLERITRLENILSEAQVTISTALAEYSRG